MSHTERATLKFIPFPIEVLQTEESNHYVLHSTLTRSRSLTPPSLTRIGSSISGTTNSEAQYDLDTSSTSSNSSVTDRSTASCEQHACSRCKLTEEEHKRIKAARRREQNRASQRRFRAKKENEIRGAADQVASLESMIQDLQIHNMELGQTNLVLKARLAELEAGQAYDNAGSSTFDTTSRCARCSREMSEATNIATDLLWPVEDIDFQQSADLGTYIPLFDHVILPHDI